MVTVARFKKDQLKIQVGTNRNYYKPYEPEILKFCDSSDALDVQ